MKKFRGTFAVLAIALALAAYIAFTNPGTQTADISKGSIFQVNVDTVQEVSIERGGSQVTVRKGDDNKWAIVAPQSLETSQEAVSSLVEAIARAEFQREIEDNPSDLEVFGLQSPLAHIEVKGNNGSKKTLLIGLPTPVGSGYYGKLADGGKVCTVSVALGDALLKTAYDLREKRIVKVANDSVEGLRIVRRVETGVVDMTDVICEKRGEDWYLLRPIVDKADKWRISEVIWDVTGLTAHGFVDDEGIDLSRWGLDNPGLRVDLITTEREKPVQVFIGDPGPGEEGFYVKTGDSQAVYLAKPEAFLPLELTSADLVDSQLVAWDHDAVIKASWALDDRNFSFQRDGKAWNKLDEIWPAIEDLRVIGVGEVLRPDIDLDAFGLGTPSIWVQLDLGDGDLIELKVGREVEDGFYATVTDRGFVYLVENDGIQALDEVLMEFSDE